MDPLVREYLDKKFKLDQGVTDARTKADWMDAGSQVGQGLADLIQPKNQVVYEKGWNETGAPVTKDFANKAADFSGIKTMGQRDLQAAQENRNQGVQDFDTEQKLTDLSTNRGRDTIKFDQGTKKFDSDMADSKQMRDKRAQDISVDKDMNTPGSKGALNFAAWMKQQFPDAPDMSSLSQARQKELTGPLFAQWATLNKPVAVDPKEKEKELLTTLQGHTQDRENFRTSPEQATKLRLTQAKVKSATEVGDRLGAAIQKQGRFNPGDGQMVADAFSWVMAVKDDNDLGALAGPDIGVIREIAPTVKTPGDLVTLINANPNIADSILKASAHMKEKAATGVKEFGYYPDPNFDKIAPAPKQAGAPGGLKPLDQMTREEKLKELQDLGG